VKPKKSKDDYKNLKKVKPETKIGEGTTIGVRTPRETEERPNSRECVPAVIPEQPSASGSRNRRKNQGESYRSKAKHKGGGGTRQPHHTQGRSSKMSRERIRVKKNFKKEDDVGAWPERLRVVHQYERGVRVKPAGTETQQKKRQRLKGTPVGSREPRWKMVSALLLATMKPKKRHLRFEGWGTKKRGREKSKKRNENRPWNTEKEGNTGFCTRKGNKGLAADQNSQKKKEEEREPKKTSQPQKLM